jgi:hypothetical protein
LQDGIDWDLGLNLWVDFGELGDAVDGRDVVRRLGTRAFRGELCGFGLVQFFDNGLSVQFGIGGFDCI